jgi:large subunit ribosomal protein L24
MKKIKTWDKVKVIAGKYKWDISVVEKVIGEKIIVKWVNVMKKAVKWQWFIDKTLPIAISNVMYYDEKNNVATRIWIKVKENWKRVRVLKKSWSEID